MENLKSIGRFHGEYPGAIIWDREDLLMFSHGVPHPYGQGVFWADLSERDADETIEEVINHFKEHNLPFWWLIGHEIKPADLADRLKSHSFFNSGDMM